MKSNCRILSLFVFALLFFNSTGMAKTIAGKTVEVTILHVNDTHSKLDPVPTALKLDINESLKDKTVYVELGGFPRLWTSVEFVRKATSNALFLHGGDAFQGTLYFTQYLGKSDVDFLNALRLDAMVLGNHEFDRGPALLKASLLDNAKFNVLSANMIYADEPELSGTKILPYTIRTIDGEKVVIIGLTTPSTPFISSPGQHITFADPVMALTSAISELKEQGINKIIVLSHLGYEEDLDIAKTVKGVDVIVGGHSHSLLEDAWVFGLSAKGPYPTVVTNSASETVLVVQSWEWAKVLGNLTVLFDAEGRVASWKGNPKFLIGDSWMRIYDLPGPEGRPVRVEFRKNSSSKWVVKEHDGRAYTVEPPEKRGSAHLDALSDLLKRLSLDPQIMFVSDHPEGARKLALYAEGVNALKKKIVCEAAEDLKRGNNAGPGPVIADAMLWKTGADVAVMNPGGVRMDVNPGLISVAQVYEIQPFGNTLVTFEIPGSDLLRVLEDMSDYTINAYKDVTPETAFIYVSGVTFVFDVVAVKGSRVRDVKVGKSGAYSPLNPSKNYKLVVNSFMASGGDRNDTLKSMSARQYDTGFIDSEATLEYIQGKVLRNRSEERVQQRF